MVHTGRKKSRNDLRVESVCLVAGHANYEHDLRFITQDYKNEAEDGKKAKNLTRRHFCGQRNRNLPS